MAPPKPLRLASARILISNDDGIHAPGLKLLEKIVRPLVKEVWVVAPETEQSGAGHSLTLRRPLRIRKVSARRFAVDGTPTDAVLLGVKQVMAGNPPDLVLSGINRGANMGEDVTYSGTVAAAMEATLLGIPAVAFSLYFNEPHVAKWATCEHWLPGVLKGLAKIGWRPGVLMNVNFPDMLAASVKGVLATVEGRRKPGSGIKEGLDPRGQPYYWIGAQRDELRDQPGTDLAAVFAGHVSVTPVSMDMTHRPSLKALQGAFQ